MRTWPAVQAVFKVFKPIHNSVKVLVLQLFAGLAGQGTLP
jgi:hypothetical protein